MDSVDKSIIMFIMNAAASIVGTIATIGIGFLIKGQINIRDEARKGREKLHKNVNANTSILTKLVQCHHINHPDQLKDD